jgi:hypothetical protein
MNASLFNPPSPPPTVVRFYGKVDYALDLIRHREIAFVHVSLLNDPFDPYCFFEIDFEGKYSNLLRYVQQHYPKHMPWFRAHVTPQSWGKTVRELHAHLDGFRKHTFMLSTSAPLADAHPKDNLYMWGHYANGHRGVAIEFDTGKLAASVIEHHERENDTPLKDQAVWTKVEYATTFPPITAADVFEFLRQQQRRESQRTSVPVEEIGRLANYYKRMTTIKSDVWKSENEWRLMWRRRTTLAPVFKCPISAECVTNIFIGLGIDDGAQAFVDEAKQAFPGAGVFQATKRHGDLALDFGTITARY